MEKLEKVIVENGITYVLGEDDIYYPDLQLPEGTDYNIGKYGHMRCEYSKSVFHLLEYGLLIDSTWTRYCGVTNHLILLLSAYYLAE